VKKLTSLLLLLGASAVPAFAASASYKNVSVVDVNCSSKAAANADAHTRACALKCAGSGYGIITNDNKFVRFDAAGNQQVVAALKASDRTDHLRVDVSGDLDGSTLRVASLKLQ
jgi:hypothetical protein